MTTESMTVAEEARLDYARTVGNSPVYMADYDEDALRRATYEQSVIRRRAQVEHQRVNPGSRFTYVDDEGARAVIERRAGLAEVTVANGYHANDLAVIRIGHTAAIGVAAAILTAAGHDHLASALNQGVKA